MRIKTLLCAAGVAALAIPAMAQNVYSLNIVGYINLTVKSNAAPLTQYGFFSNPLTNTDMTVGNILTNAPSGTKCYIWDYTINNYGTYTKRPAGNWTGGSGGLDGTIRPGISFFIQNNTTSNLTVTLTGTVPTGTNNATYGQGLTFVSPAYPVGGLIQTALGLPAVNGDKVYEWDQTVQNWTITTRRASSWTGGVGSEPTIAVAEGMIYFGGANSPVSGGTWVRSFTTN